MDDTWSINQLALLKISFFQPQLVATSDSKVQEKVYMLLFFIVVNTLIDAAVELDVKYNLAISSNGFTVN